MNKELLKFDLMPREDDIVVTTKIHNTIATCGKCHNKIYEVLEGSAKIRIRCPYCKFMNES